MSDESNSPANGSVPVRLVLPDHWRNRIRAISKWARKNLLAIIIAIAISATSAYIAYQSKNVSLKNPDMQSRNDRPAIAIIHADVEGFGEEKIHFSLQFKNLETKTAHSLAIDVVGFDPKTEKVRQLAHIAGTAPVRHDTSFSSAFIKRSEMLPVVVLCLLYADEDRRGFSEHLYYDAPDASKISGRIALSKLAPEACKRVDNLKICRM